MKRILATPRSFAKYSDEPISLLRSAGYEVVMNPYGKIMTGEQLKSELCGCEGVIIGVDPLDKEVLQAAGELRAISKYGVGLDNIDLDFAKERGIPVTVTSGANSNAVADFAWALMMSLARRLPEIDARCRQRDWTKLMGLDVYGKTLGILGMGAIGKGMAKRASGFDMKIMGYDLYWDGAFAEKYGVIRCMPEEIFRQSDFISVHLPLTRETLGFIGRREIDMMKKSVILVNTARGGIVDENELISALKEGRVFGAGIDAFSQEPPDDERWYGLGNLIMGNHAAASTAGASRAMSLMAARNLLENL